MDRFQEMQVFQAVAEEKSFNRAAQRMRLSAPSVTRAVAALEKRLGTRLLVRTTRGVRPTESGERFLADCRRILGELEEAEASAATSQSQARGTLSITAPVLFGDLFVTPILVDFLEREPGISIRAVFADRIIAMADEGIDVAIRIGELPDSGLSAKRVGRVRRVVCAAPSLIARRGRPASPHALADWPIVVSASSALLTEWRFRKGREETSVRVAPRLVVTSNRAAVEAARLGAGATRVLSYQADAFVATGELELLFEDHALEALPVHVVYAGGSKAPAKVRAFVDACVAALRRLPALA